MAFPYAKILCPVDFDENSLEALDRAVAIARHFNAKLLVMHVVPLVLQFGEVPIPPQTYKAQKDEAMAKLNQLAIDKLGGVEHETHIYTGDVHASILQAIEKFTPDLVVMATHGRVGLSHLILGSVAEVVVRKANCPVMTIRAGHA
jgi:nucleotide-binding universal stress UspA family protein